MELDRAVVDHLLSTTRSVRRKLDLDRPVPDEVITECLRLAIQAPTAGNTQNWRWLVVRDQEKKAAIGKLFRTAGEAYLNARKADADPKMLASGHQLVDSIERVPVFVIPCLVGRPPADAVGQAVFYGSIFPAVWSFQLALRSRGLGTTLTSYHLNFEAEAARILGVPADVTQVGLLPVAYTTVADFNPAPRRPVEEITHWDTWTD
jgi:nitroreductase